RMRPLDAKGKASSAVARRWNIAREGRGAVCQSCGRALAATWRPGGRLCCECGLNEELFHPEARGLNAELEAPRPPPRRRAARARPSPVLRLGLKSLGAIAPGAADEL